MIARTVKDVILFDSIFSDCHYPRPDLVLRGTRLGYPVNYWKGLDTRVRASHKTLEQRCIEGTLLCQVKHGSLTAVLIYRLSHSRHVFYR